MELTGSLTTRDGRALTYRSEGSGPALVCHPGGPGFSSAYFGDLAGLSERRTLVLLNPRGTDGSDRPADANGYRIADYVDDLEQLHDHFGLGTFDLLGHSHGGVVAMAYGAAYPTRVGRLVLASTLVRFGEEQKRALEAGVAARADEPWYADACAALAAEEAGEFDSDEELAALARRELPFYFARFGERERAYVEALDEIPNGDALRLFNKEILGAFDLRPELALIEAETLVLTGSEDFITGPVCPEEIADGISDARLVLVPGAGHFVFVEARERFRALELGFLEGAA